MTMSSTPQSSSSTLPLATFAGFVGTIGIFLYYSGWIYRWAYFDSFAVDVKTLNFPAESFLIVTIQVFLGDFARCIQIVMVTFGTIILAQTILWLVNALHNGLTNNALSIRLRRLYPLAMWIDSIVLRPIRWLTKLVPIDVIKDLVIVSCLLFALFFFARYQGAYDAFRDAVDSTSRRPVVTLLGPAAKLPVGRDPNDSSLVSSSKETRFIGSKEELEEIRKRDYNEPGTNRTWRLLAENGSWVYIFPSQDKNIAPRSFPPVLAINTGDGRVQVLILNHSSKK
jgi:hypothetical protein